MDWLNRYFIHHVPGYQQVCQPTALQGLLFILVWSDGLIEEVFYPSCTRRSTSLSTYCTPRFVVHLSLEWWIDWRGILSMMYPEINKFVNLLRSKVWNVHPSFSDWLSEYFNHCLLGCPIFSLFSKFWWVRHFFPFNHVPKNSNRKILEPQS